MGGGLIQLLAYGAENQYLMGNPQITFWKLVYKRHTNFSMEHIEVFFDGKQELTYNSTTKIRCKIPRHADLVNRMYFKAIIPGIRSSKEDGVRFIKHLGSTMIKEAKLFIGGSLIDTLYGEWIYIYNDLFLSSSKRGAYNVMIGNTKSRYEIGTVEGSSIGNINGTTVYEEGRDWDTVLDITPSVTNTYSKIRTFTTNTSNTNTYNFKSLTSMTSITATTDFHTQKTLYTVTAGSAHDLSTGDIIKFDGAGYYATFDSVDDNLVTTSENPHNLLVNDKILYTKGSGANLDGLTDGNYYYIKTVPDDNKFTLSESIGGDTITLTNGNSTNTFTTDTKFGATNAVSIIKTGANTFTFITSSNLRTETTKNLTYVDETLHYYVNYSSKQDITMRNIYVIPPWQINVPLNFWFTKNPGLSIPLIALQYHEVEVELELRPIEELYQIKDTDKNSNTYGKYIRPDSNKSSHKLENFSINKNFILNAPNAGKQKDTGSEGWGFSPTLEIKYIYLDKEERKVFANIEHEYLIEQVVRRVQNGIVGENTFEVKLYHPLKEIIVVTKRDDVESYNEWTNFTNSESILQSNNDSVNLNRWNKCVYTPEGKCIITHHDNIVQKGFSDILVNMEIKMNGLTRQGNRYYSYYKYIQPYEAHTSKAETRGIYVYSFCLNNESYQPTGCMNASRINKIELHVKTRIPYMYTELLDTTTFPKPSDQTYLWKYNFIIYAVNFNVLRISSGMGSIQFAN